MKNLSATLLSGLLLSTPAFAALPAVDLPMLTFPPKDGTLSTQGTETIEPLESVEN